MSHALLREILLLTSKGSLIDNFYFYHRFIMTYCVIGVFGQKGYHVKNDTFPAIDYYTSKEMVLTTPCGNCTFMHGMCRTSTVARFATICEQDGLHA